MGLPASDAIHWRGGELPVERWSYQLNRRYEPSVWDRSSADEGDFSASAMILLRLVGADPGWHPECPAETEGDQDQDDVGRPVEVRPAISIYASVRVKIRRPFGAVG